MKKKTPKISEMTEKELKTWDNKLRYLEGDTSNKHAFDKINQGRGWIF